MVKSRSRRWGTVEHFLLRLLILLPLPLLLLLLLLNRGCICLNRNYFCFAVRLKNLLRRVMLHLQCGRANLLFRRLLLLQPRLMQTLQLLYLLL